MLSKRECEVGFHELEALIHLGSQGDDLALDAVARFDEVCQRLSLLLSPTDGEQISIVRLCRLIASGSLGSVTQQTLGDRLVWIRSTKSDAHRLLQDQRCGILSSTLGRNFSYSKEWTDKLLGCLGLVSIEQDTILFSSNSPAATAVKHFCDRLGFRSFSVATNAKRTFRQWWDHQLQQASRNALEQNVSVSPPIVGVLPSGRGSMSGGSVEIPDAMIAMMASRLFIVATKHESKVHRIAMSRLKPDSKPSAVHVFLNHSDTVQTQNAAAELIANGAIGHYQIGERDGLNQALPPNWPHTHQADRDHACAARQPNQLIVHATHFPELNRSQSTWRFLTHCTRGRAEAWPEYSRYRMLDELLVDRSDMFQNGGPLQTLRRILLQNRLVATNWYQNDRRSTVCFSEKPLEDLLSQRIFRSHLGRWDWEPYGVCIDKNWLIGRGAKPVRYGRQAELEEANYAELPFIQSPGKKGQWEDEEEFRILDDIRMLEVPIWKAFVFVPSMAEASQLAPISRFPIVVLGESMLAGGNSDR